MPVAGALVQETGMSVKVSMGQIQAPCRIFARVSRAKNVQRAALGGVVAGRRKAMVKAVAVRGWRLGTGVCNW